MPTMSTRPTIALVLLLSALLAACAMPPVEEPTAPPVLPTPTEPVEPEPTRESASTEPATVHSLPAAATVRTGPGTEYDPAFWINAGTELTVVGRNTDGDWLQVELEEKAGWIFGPLTDIAADVRAVLPVTEPPVAVVEEIVEAPEPEPVPATEPEAAVEAPAPQADESDEGNATAPEPPPAPTATPETADMLQVTGSTVNLRSGPGTHHPIVGQVRRGENLTATGRNADGSWLRVMHPATTGEHVWIFAGLTDIGATGLAALEVVGIAVAPAEAQPAAPAPPAAQPAGAAPTVPADCTRLHTVNPNETRLQQITDWFGLDLAATAALNGIAPDTPLTAGTQLCLPDAAALQEQPAAPSAPTQPSPGACDRCPSLPDFTEQGHPNAPIGQKVVDSPLDILWHGPGSYSRDLPGLDHDFDLVLVDDSTMWKWHMRDPQACYDAVRVHMGEVASEVNLQRLEVRLSDPVYPQNRRGYIPGADYGNWFESPWVNHDGLSDWPNLDPAKIPHPDLGLVTMYCDYAPPTGQISCDIYPDWGNSHSIHLNAAATLAIANSIAVASDNARAYRHNSLDPRILEFNAYLFPILDNNLGDPAGQGPCLDVARAK